MDVVRVGRVIRAIRMHRGWRQVDLAESADVSQSLITYQSHRFYVTSLRALTQRDAADL